ncbi:acyl-CoA thioesterase [Rhodospirillum rubrum]|uniref:Thioesterase superfamily n=1 Tax=Rhodospirillum rubrum (strain ATCC 11170 / ATH 1.1.1 / DSM 467 / LMG 4362 / NCIMB 8255 / S1) TaxID=269796 RepID=Q2RQT9_RHORT|nr:acyl-CoA thioesterase [Rhodospirillum rubrum]ABC23506.1 Thioesterase superfamily [Rhodospirillum rubrum ATCC 11170]AEO49245.1 thioesterase superfamily protein [Rhodospirillum rubrum F11]MBK5955178.1 acyl-CoA thioesterase [Rhodospirillum rubrum]QXG79474.1 acyl-CoA thioesterase [Rhodospirillum rubrum]HAP98892.1 acyl-CoA thioesterase [Rhodospirillum rubrum]
MSCTDDATTGACQVDPGVEAGDEPRGTVSIRTIAMPADTNPSGDIFGGWLMAQMDLAGGTHARKAAGGRVVTVAVNGFSFHLPVKVGDEVTCYTEIIKRGRTSLTLDVQAWVCRQDGGAKIKVTEGVFVFVALDAEGRARPLPPVVSSPR